MAKSQAISFSKSNNLELSSVCLGSELDLFPVYLGQINLRQPLQLVHFPWRIHELKNEFCGHFIVRLDNLTCIFSDRFATKTAFSIECQWLDEENRLSWQISRQ